MNSELLNVRKKFSTIKHLSRSLCYSLCYANCQSIDFFYYDSLLFMNNSYICFCFTCAYTLSLLYNNKQKYCFKPYSYQKFFFNHNFLSKNNKSIKKLFPQFELNQSLINQANFFTCYECNQHSPNDLPFMILNIAVTNEINDFIDEFDEASKFNKKLTLKENKKFSNLIHFCDNLFQMALNAPVSIINNNFNFNKVKIFLPNIKKNVEKHVPLLHQLPVWFYQKHVIINQQISNTTLSKANQSFNTSSNLFKSNSNAKEALFSRQPILKRKKLERKAKNYDPLSEFNWLNLSPRIALIENKNENKRFNFK